MRKVSLIVPLLLSFVAVSSAQPSFAGPRLDNGPKPAPSQHSRPTAASEKPSVRPNAVVAELEHLAQKPLWPGFTPAEIPVAVFDGEKTFLYRHPAPPEGFTQVAAEEDVWILDGRHPAIVANTSTDIGGVRTATVLLTIKSGRDAADFAAVTIHEMFHVFQGERPEPWPTGNSAHLFTYPMTDVENCRWWILENLALAHALEGNEDQTAASWIARFLKIRKTRYERIDENSAQYERGIEWHEGSAQYVEFLALGRASDSGALRSDFAANEIRKRSYATGRALAALLDRFDPGWKQKLGSEPAKPLDRMLASAVADREPVPASFPEEDKSTAARAAEGRVETLKAELRAERREFEALAAPKVIVRAGRDEPLRLKGQDPMNVLRLDAKEVLHRRYLKAGNSAGLIETMGVKAVTVGLGEHPLYTGLGEVRIGGFSAEPAVRVDGDRVEIEMEELKLDLSGAKVDRENGNIVITLGRE